MHPNAHKEKGDIDMNIEATVWKITDGEIIELKHNDTIFTKKQPKTTRIETPMEIIGISSSPNKKPRGHGIKQCYLEKWITNNDFDVFTLDMFYKAYPMQKENKNLDSNISKLIAEKKIIQLGKNKFKVIKKC